jgi:hypothetical protein
MNNVIWIAVVRIVVESSVQSAALALCVGGILAAARIRSGAVRHGAWVAVLCGMMLMPLLSRIAPKVDVPIQLPALERAEEPTPGQRFRPMTVVFAGQPPKFVAPKRSGKSDWHPVPWNEHVPWSAVALSVYLAGMLFLLARLIPGWRAANQIVRASAPVPILIQDAEVRESELVTTPLTVGLHSPRIVLPTSWREWSDTKLQAVLAHEAAHVSNRDSLVNFAAYLNRCVFWFHPLAWWLEKKLTATAEHASDEAGARAVGDGKEYARVLIEVAAAICPGKRRYAFVSAGMKGDGGLEERIDRILLDDVVRVVSPARKLTVTVACAVAIVAIAACRQVSTRAGKAQQPIPEVTALLSTRARPGSPEFESRVEGARDKLAQSNDVEVLASNGQAIINRFGVVPRFGGESSGVAQEAIGRALKLDPNSQAAREAGVTVDRAFLMSARWNPEDPEARTRLARINAELSQSTDVGFLLTTAVPMVSMEWPTTHGMAAGAEVFAVGKAAVERALKLDPNSVWAHQLMLKIRDQELVVSLPEQIWAGPLESRRQAIQGLPNGERFREMSLLAASAGDEALRAATMQHDPVIEKARWDQAGRFAQEALTIAPTAKEDADYGTSLFRANMVAGMAALVRGDKTTAIQFARNAMDAPPTEALRYPIVNARPWSNWHYPDMLIARLLKDGDRDAAADIAERYSHMVTGDRERWVDTLATIRKGDMPPWVQMPGY